MEKLPFRASFSALIAADVQVVLDVIALGVLQDCPDLDSEFTGELPGGLEMP
jgi:hypothetical protein